MMIKNIDQTEKFKKVMGNYPTGVTVVTTKDRNGTPVGLTVNSFASVSLAPLLISWCIDKSASSFDVFNTTNQFAVHILASEQEDLCHLFACKGADRFNQCEWTTSELQLPIIKDVFAVLQCNVFQRVEAGDHQLLIGKVEHIDKAEKEPLLYHRRKVGSIPSDFYSNNI